MATGGIKVSVDSLAVSTVVRWMSREQPDDPEIMEAAKVLAVDALRSMRDQLDTNLCSLTALEQELQNMKGPSDDAHSKTDSQQHQTPAGDSDIA